MKTAKPEISSLFVARLEAGRVCLHPTDTIPGLTCHPLQEKVVQSLLRIKGRSNKPMLGLVASLDQALQFWEPLPSPWEAVLTELWPGPLTVVWKARDGAPACLLSASGEMALRCPNFKSADSWLGDVLRQLRFPLPSTSVNYAGGKALVDSKAVAEFCKAHDVWIPPIELFPSDGEHPSSVIRIRSGGVDAWIRKGVVSDSRVEECLSRLGRLSGGSSFAVSSQPPPSPKWPDGLQIFLASASPRRSELLKQAGIAFEVVSSGYDEKNNHGFAMDPRGYVEEHARLKGAWLLKDRTFRDGLRRNAVIISADTIVLLGTSMLEKPQDQDDAARMLASLSGKWHKVLTGMCFHFVEAETFRKKVMSAVFESEVLFRPLSGGEIQDYVTSGEPMDKAGAYALQGRGTCFIRSIRGSFTNVIGLPLAEAVEWLQAAPTIFRNM